jgi:hypothetical protein
MNILVPTYLGTVNIKVDQLAVRAEFSTEIFSLNLLGDVSDVTHSSLLLRGSRDRLRPVLSLCVVTANVLPATGRVGVLLLLLSSRWRRGSWGLSRLCGLSSWRSTSLCRRGGSFGCNRWDGWLGRTSCGGCAASPGQRLRGCCWLSCSRLGRGGTAGGSWRWGRLGWNLHLALLVHSFLGNIRRDGWLFGLCGSLGGYGSAVSGRGLGSRSWGSFDSLLQLLINLCDVQGGRSRLLDTGLCLGHLNILHQRASRLILGTSGVHSLILAFLIDVSEDIVEYEVSGRLLGEDKGLDKLLKLGGFVGCLADDLDDDILE